ncbi:hypothetical protein PHMEG_00016951 [Phytophthora megakarya]|uniref:HTH CENPB-type domain-containing protein n=1 Tax=Phytophthora megakarya TaxID=4795 RepID=A0A225VXP6_9STRA|nr:hypothetical protein PHMEG_00016951 [Phytophthora megakarya]
MARPSIKNTKKKKKQYKRVSVHYQHKHEILVYLDKGHTIGDALEKFYRDLDGKQRRKQQQQISKWSHNRKNIDTACETGRGSHRNLREPGTATVLSPRAEEELILWINSLRKDGAPVSRTTLKLKAKDVAAEEGLSEEQFAASPSWMQLFMQRKRMSLRTKTRQGQTTPEDAAEEGRKFVAEVLKIIVEKRCVQVFNADQTVHT